MEKKFSDEELDRLLEEQYLKEADMIAEELFSDDLDQFADETEEELDAAYDALVEKLKAEGIYREENTNSADAVQHRAVHDEDTVLTADRHKRTGRSGRFFRIAKAAGFVVVCALGVFAASMTSEANRKYFIESVYYLRGSNVQSIIDNDKTNENVNENEYKARKDIKEKLGMEMPEFFYEPKGFLFYDYEVNDVIGIGVMRYEYKDNIVSSVGLKNDEVKKSANFNLHGAKTKIITLKYKEVPIKIFEVKDGNDNLASYMAEWKYKDVLYQVTGKTEKEEFIKLIKKLSLYRDFVIVKSYIFL